MASPEVEHVQPFPNRLDLCTGLSHFGFSRSTLYLPSPVGLRRASIHNPPSNQPTDKTTMSTTDTLHKQCRTLESLFDNKLTAYSRLAATITRPGSHDLESTGSLERWKDLEVELEELLQKVSTTSAYSWFGF